MVATGALFEGRSLACRRGDRLVFEGLDFALAPGGALLITGVNGSGKSSLLRIMAGLIEHEAGVLSWAGRALDARDHGERLVYVGHADPVKPVLSVFENLVFCIALAARTTRAAERPKAAREALAAFGLEHLRSLPARFLSAGQRRRLSLARLAAISSALWLLDEPTSGLDEASVAFLETRLAAHRQEGGMVALASHVAIALPGAAALDLANFASSPRPAA